MAVTSASPALVLVVEDEPDIATAVADRLGAEGWTVEVAGDGHAGVAAASRLHPDLVVLDVMLPGIDGHEVCRRIQRERAVPVLMLTALDAETDLLVGLGVGADDYMTKPFSQREFVARVRALLRRVKLGRCLDTLPERLALAHTGGLGHAEFLELVLADEVTRRETTSADRRARAAGLDPAMTLDRWDDSAKVTYDHATWRELCSRQVKRSHARRFWTKLEDH